MATDEDNNHTKWLSSPAIVPAPPQIRHGASGVAIRNATSFLDLPAELRNDIYAYALVLDGPLFIVSGRLHCHRDHTYNNIITVGELENTLNWHSTDKDLLRATLHIQGILATCRQVYHEASSVFFSQNRLAISRTCREDSPYFTRHDFYGKYLAQGSEWLVTIGSQLSKLQNVVLDVSALCWPDVGYLGEGGACIELLPLLRVLWNRQWTGKVEFCNPSPPDLTRPHCNTCGLGWHRDGIIDSKMLTKMLTALRVDDLNIRRFERAMSHVAVDREGYRGVVLFRSTHPDVCSEHATHKYYSEHDIPSRGVKYACLQHRLDFTLDLNEGISQVPGPAPLLLNFPYHIRRQIFDYLLLSDEAISINLNRAKDHVSGLLFLRRALHTREVRCYYMVNRFILHINYKLEGSEVCNLNALERWLSTSDFSGRGEKMAGLKGQNVHSLHLNFDVQDGRTLAPDDISINTGALLRHGVHLGNRGASVSINVRIGSSSTCSNGSNTSSETAFSLYSLRLQVLRALRQLRDAGLGLQRGNDVDVVVNGYGIPVGYVFPGLDEVHRLP